MTLEFSRLLRTVQIGADPFTATYSVQYLKLKLVAAPIAQHNCHYL